MTCQGISLGLVSIGCCFFLSVTRRVASIFSSHGVSRRSRIILSRICEFFLHTENRGDHGFFLSRFFSLSRICELFLHTDCRGIIFFITNYRIIEYHSHEVSRMVVGLALHANGGYSSLSIGQYGESVSDDHRSGWNCCLASPEIDVSPFMSSPLVIVPLMTGAPEALSRLYSSISMMLIVGS